MPPLSSNLRNDLGRVIVKARQAAESGARNALDSLAVGHHEPHGSMSLDDRALRNRLRARGRQLGDVRDKQRGSQSIDRLLHEVAYEHWHRMLFARYLAENELLIHPEHKVAVSLDEVEELAREAGIDPRDLAAQYAQGALPQIFRSGDPVLDVKLPPESRQALDKLLDSLPSEVFTADDSLGWTYQYWQTEKKDAVNASGDKHGADEISAVTQLFTEHYMVLFLYHNTIGAWRASRILAGNPSLAETATNEQELRDAVRLESCGGYDFEYLRFVRTEVEGDEEGTPTGPWRPTAGTFADWPQAAKDLTILDPCCGSGHFLTAGFELMVRLRMDEESLSNEDAIRAVVAENLHGLELDPRCTQISAFNLAMAAWKLAGKPVALPPMHIACSGLALGSTRDEWKTIAGNDSRLQVGMERLYDLFRQAPTLGSLLDPRTIVGDLLDAGFEELAPLLDAALAKETAATDTPDATERIVAAKGMAAAADLLSRRYTLCITNVPYLGRKQQDQILADYGEMNYPEAKNDLATMFVERMLRWTEPAGSIAAVTPQNWLFSVRNQKLREKLLSQRRWDFVARLGEHAFESSAAAGAFAAMIQVSAARPHEDHSMAGVDASAPRGQTPIYAADKATLLRGDLVEGLDRDPDNFAVRVVEQKKQLQNPAASISFSGGIASFSLLEERCTSLAGSSAGDKPRFAANWWEMAPRMLGDTWEFYQSSPSSNSYFGGRELAVLWESEEGEIAALADSVKHLNHIAQNWLRGKPHWGSRGVVLGIMAKLPFALYDGQIYDCNCCAIVPRSESDIAALWCFVESGAYAGSIRKLNPALAITTSTFKKVPFDLDHWTKVAATEYPNGLPEPQSNDPTQWLFHGHPAGMLEAGDARNPNPADLLQVAVGRLLGYRWPPELDPEMRLDPVAREWANRCDELKEFADEDGIVCLSATRGERSAADRVRELLVAALGSDWSANKERELLAAIAAEQSTEKKTVQPAASLEDWLRDDFFTEHCKLFHHRPFVWHIWDGNKNGFHCLVNAHKITGPDGEARRTLEAITYSYLGDWIDRQRADQADGKEGADARLIAAQDLQAQLEKILEGEAPYDLFVRWKALHEQAIGWEPDINDGVRLNIRPFMTTELAKGGKKGAGLLRWKPNIKWGPKVDKGKEPQSLRPKIDFPWFWSCDDQATDFAGGKEFDGNRWNDLHYTRATKEAARQAAAERESQESAS